MDWIQNDELFGPIEMVFTKELYSTLIGKSLNKNTKTFWTVQSINLSANMKINLIQNRMPMYCWCILQCSDTRTSIINILCVVDI